MPKSLFGPEGAGPLPWSTPSGLMRICCMTSIGFTYGYSRCGPLQGPIHLNLGHPKLLCRTPKPYRISKISRSFPLPTLSSLSMVSSVSF